LLAASATGRDVFEAAEDEICDGESHVALRSGRSELPPNALPVPWLRKYAGTRHPNLRMIVSIRRNFFFA
jgi:hypothetical protein